LGKKSWNVYNQDNIERVKRDEAAAKALEEAEEQRMQEADAERRMQILRGEIPAPLKIEDKPDDGSREGRPLGRESQGPGRERKRRKKTGEDDTDFEMRIAHEQSASSSTEKQIVLRKPVDAPLLDHSGHIDLFPQERDTKPAQKNAEAEKETAKRRKSYEDQYTMRFSNAAGFRQGLDNPWYSKATAKDQVDEDIPSKDAWGNEDPRRKEREAARIVSSDPLAMMRQGAAQARQVEKERKRWREEKEKELRELMEAEERKKPRKRRHEEDDDDEDLGNFRLDAPESHSSRRHDDHDRERSHKRRHRESRRPSHREESSRHRHRHRHRRGDD
jgi:hypothetical protein